MDLFSLFFLAALFQLFAKFLLYSRRIRHFLLICFALSRLGVKYFEVH